MTNITLHPDKEKGIAVAVRKIKNYYNKEYFYAIEITVSDTYVTIYANEVKDIVKMTNDIDCCVMQIIDHE